jgi:hypothetical protein
MHVSIGTGLSCTTSGTSTSASGAVFRLYRGLEGVHVFTFGGCTRVAAAILVATALFGSECRSGCATRSIRLSDVVVMSHVVFSTGNWHSAVVVHTQFVFSVLAGVAYLI